MRRSGFVRCSVCVPVVLAECVERRVVSEMGETEYIGVGVGVEIGRMGVGEDMVFDLWCFGVCEII
jgi:hypothetical protein